MPAQPRDMRGWLMRIHEAASRQNFQGTFVVSGGGNVASARMAHFCEGANQYERIESLDGKARNVFRHNDIVHTVWPASKVAVVEHRDLLNSFPALLQAGGDGIADWYEMQPQGDERVAGHEANVLLVTPKDAYRYGYRLWSDKGSGLLLRADVLGEHGEVLETSAFSDVAIGGRSQPETVLQPMRRLEGYRVLRPILTPTRLDSEGWAMRQVAPGFRQVSCVNRQMENSGDVEATGGAQQVLQAIYADGMTYVSVFIEPYLPKRHARPMQVAVGATQTLSMRQGDWWVTVVGDVPTSTLRLFANALERKK
ncbi:MAG: MucB/RseB C-terminal domain-containing protein [Caldimonas sp.]